VEDLGALLSGNNLPRLLGGLWVSVRVALASMAVSIALGLPLGAAMTLKNPLIRLLCRAHLEFVRFMPQLVLLFIVYFGFTRAFGLNLSGEASAVAVFSFWGAAEMGDLCRGALQSVPWHQYESAAALGLPRIRVYISVIIPQAIRRLIPPAVNLTTRMIKTTSLIALIGVADVLKVGQQVIEGNRYAAPKAALWVYGGVFLLYFAACFPISKLAAALERKAGRNG
jgi:polar amino acid transport system permease protein